METRFHWFVCVFSGNFGVRGIVLCKCSGNVLIGYENITYVVFLVDINLVINRAIFSVGSHSGLLDISMRKGEE